jgi:hypothetical protein
MKSYNFRGVPGQSPIQLFFIAGVLLASMAQTSCGDEDLLAEFEADDSENEKYISGITQFPEVVQIAVYWPIQDTGYCNATAVSSSTLLTAGSCVFDPKHGGLADYVVVNRAKGGNSRSTLSSSTRVALHDDFYENYNGSDLPDTLGMNNFALIVFGEGTFDVSVPIGVDNLPSSGIDGTVVGYRYRNKGFYQTHEFPEEGTIHLQERLINETNSYYKYNWYNGAPWIHVSGGQRRVIGVIGNNGILKGAYINQERSAGLKEFLDNLIEYSVTGFMHDNYEGRRWSFPHNEAMNDFYGDISSVDSLTLQEAHLHKAWNDEFSSIKVGSEIYAVFHDDVCSGSSFSVSTDQPNLRALQANDWISCVTTRLTPPPTYWTYYTSEEYNSIVCENGLVQGMQCNGSYCDNVKLNCDNFSGDLQATGHRWTEYFSEDGNNSRSCEENEFVTAIQCRGHYCDDVRLRCSTYDDISKGINCYWLNPTLSEEDGGILLAPEGYFLTGLACQGRRYCDNKKLRVCTPS